jgi:hypothetical protein
MPVKNREKNPIAFIAIGVCFIGAGVALSAALHSRGGSVVGIGLIGVGVTFLIIGVTQKRKLESGESAGDEEDRPGP